ncbi:MAG: helix-turn-helix transcriptional regulator [Gammaproteobacteria bacterium]|nr:helix-turn-helix transcriptional regulator [Gammaproteobacteria bacterium]
MMQKTVSPGKLLIAARDALALTQDEIAKQLRLSIKMVSDLEQDIYARMGARTYVRGYLRSYARLVGVSEIEITEVFDASGLMADPSQSSTPIIEGAPVRNVTRQPLRLMLPRWQIMAGAAAAVLLLIILIVSLSGPKKPTVKKVEAPSTPALTTLPAPIPAAIQLPPAAIAQPVVENAAPIATPAVETLKPFVHKKKHKEQAPLHITYTIKPA